MSYVLSPAVTGIEAAPIAAVRALIAGRSFPADRPLIDLTQAAPGYPPPAELTDHLARRLADPAIHRYGDILGVPALREAYAEHLGAFHRTTIKPSQVAITAGCNQAFCAAMMALASAGDSVLLPRPHYFNHAMWLRMLGVRPVPLDFRDGSGAVPDPADAEALIDRTTRAIVLVSPNNPSGATYPPAVIEAFYALAKRRRIALVLDETYKDFLPDTTRPHRIFDDPDWPQTLIHLYSFSKVYALPGHRVGALTAGPAALAEIEKVMDCVAICAPRPGQEAALYGLRHLAGWARERIAAVVARGRAFGDLVARSNRWRLVSLGAYFAYLEHPFAGAPAMDVVRRLADAQHLLLLPGTTFGEGQERFVRLAYANVVDDVIPDVVARLDEAAR
ncbi:MAG: aminotransferase [Alphaproteobacteria bacterium]|nr:aminotransferase [Alphaproteobacteria bacterium]